MSDLEESPVKGRLSLKRRALDSDSEESEAAGTPVKVKDDQTPAIKKNKVSPLSPNGKMSTKMTNLLEQALWKKGEKVPYLALAKAMAEMELEKGRLKKAEIISNYLYQVIELTPEDTLPSIYLSLNKLGPDYEGLELGIGETLIMKALAAATGRNVKDIKADVEKKGDLGLVAETSRSKQRMLFKPAPLTIRGVYDKLKQVAELTGNSSALKKTDMIQSLMVSCREEEARYLVRSLSGKLRTGLAEQSFLMGLGQAIALHENKGLSRNNEKFKQVADKTIDALKTAYCEFPNYGQIMKVVFEHGSEKLTEHCKITPGIPVKPMLAHPTKGIDEVLKRFDDSLFTSEYKYDGERAQIHLTENGEIRIYSRHQENFTEKYPDIVSRIPQAFKEGITSFIIDAEAVAWCEKTKTILPFQVLTTRKRKDVKEEDIKVKACVFAFDILYLNGKAINQEPLRVRREHLRNAFEVRESVFSFAQSRDVVTTEEIQELMEIAVKDKCEGLMVKRLDQDATYEIAKRSRKWLKVKKDYLEGVGDTLDIVVIGGWYGKGKRTGVYGGFLLACYDDENEEYQTICKIGTGFSDEMLEKHSTFLKEHIIPKPKSYYVWDEGAQPDVWFDAVQVWEVKCADLSISPVHRAALGRVDSDKGISLRFPRFVRIRDDKKPEQATTAEQVADMYLNQESVKKSSKDVEINDEAEDDEVY